MTAYYNEIDPYAAQWLRNLILKGHLPRGDVDERSIVDVSADDLKGYDQCHFFAGIGGWSLALRLALWPDDRLVWTGSCPCQPFSSAGKQKGKDDPRHLWPVWFRLIRECRPTVVFGEQVAPAITHGWLDDAANDLEGQGYGVAAAVLPACSVGAPHRRNRLWFVAHADQQGSQGRNSGILPQCASEQPSRASHSFLAYPQDNRNVRGHGQLQSDDGAGECRGDFQRGAAGHDFRQWWKAEPSVGRLAYGVPSRVGRLRAYGNAIVPQVAAEFIKAAM